MKPYAHGLAPNAVELSDILLSGSYEDYEVLSETEAYELLFENQKEE